MTGALDALDTLVFVTSNSGKAREASAILGRPVEPVTLDLPEIQSLDFAEVVRAKAVLAARLLGSAVLVEDSGLTVAAWGGFPGPLTKWAVESIGLEGFARMLDPFGDRRGEAVSSLGVARAGAVEAEVMVALGRVRGTIAPAPRGTGGFGWDVLFVPDGGALTFAEMTAEGKNAVSHRARAFRSLRALLAG